MIRFGKYHKKLQDYYELQNRILDKYSELTESIGCFNCDCYDKEIGLSYENRFNDCKNCSHNTKVTACAREADSIAKAIDDYIENEYAHAVFSYYSKKKPLLVRISTNEEYTWDRAFGNSFEEIEKTLRHALVGLVERTGRYRIK